ncbi:hypothetical protein EUGRSUZ_B00530 [Eucalyptus grandis]|uniref:J domain-containing protein n=2 Tax=Eucalyptus grandis TaxID=71139 RepID=A0A059CZJ2_EUCGR|nr:hypothetical protein EUGRSUZ_B00530 [Eucalyptus grandis]
MARVSSMLTTVKAYSVPLMLLIGAMLYQLVIIPNTFPESHYDVLGLKRHSSIEEVDEAYEKLVLSGNLDGESRKSSDFIKIRYAYELLTNPIWKRNYDMFGIEEQHDVIEKAKQQYAGKSYSEVQLPLLDAAASDTGDEAFNAITLKDVLTSKIDSPWLFMIYSSGSRCCAHRFGIWKRIAALLDGVANTGAVELGEVQLAAYLAERKPTGQLFYRNGIPSVVAFPPQCRNVDCLVRFEGELTTDAVTDWFATAILSLPRIRYYSKESLGQAFIAKTSPHKVKVIFFSKTGERATPFVRVAAKNYWAYASFAFILWTEEESSFWWNTFEVESAPAIVILKDPGFKPVVHHGPVNNSWFSNMIEQNKHQELPQLRTVTSHELGCDARGYSRAGVNVESWYCVILAGRLSRELNEMRRTMCRIQETLSSDGELSSTDNEESPIHAAVALKEKRLTFTWLNGESQQKYCLFYLQSETSYDTCGPRQDVADVPRLFIVRYKRNSTEENTAVKKNPRNMWDALLNEDVDPAAQLVARYNGSNEIPEIIKWIANIVKDGDSRDLPFYRTKTPELVPEDEEPMFLKGAQNILSKGTGMKQKIHGFVRGFYDRLGDPRIGPYLLLGALLSFGAIWLRRSQPSRPSQPDQSEQPSQPSQPDQSEQPSTKAEARTRRRARQRMTSKKDAPSSITDVEPKDAYQMPLSDPDSE